jgi:putative ABC transport system substrate-binding protein
LGLGFARATNAALAQSAPPRVGLLFFGSENASPGFTAFRDALRDLGYVEGKTVFFYAQYADGSLERLAAHAAQFARENVAAIVAFGAAPTQEAMRATRTIPVIMAAVGEPVASGYVATLSRPGGNVTGVGLDNAAVAVKQVEMLHEVVPFARNLAVVFHGSDTTPDHPAVAAASSVGLGPTRVAVPNAEELQQRLAGFGGSGIDAIFVASNPWLDGQRFHIARFARAHRLPTMGPFRIHAQDGFLLSYGPKLSALHRRAASFLDRVLRGTSPAELPVEMPDIYELFVNREVAHAIGLTIPPTLLARADEVIE